MWDNGVRQREIAKNSHVKNCQADHKFTVTRLPGKQNEKQNEFCFFFKFQFPVTMSMKREHIVHVDEQMRLSCVTADVKHQAINETIH